jgi:hypothetical protein
MSHSTHVGFNGPWTFRAEGLPHVSTSSSRADSKHQVPLHIGVGQLVLSTHRFDQRPALAPLGRRAPDPHDSPSEALGVGHNGWLPDTASGKFHIPCPAAIFARMYSAECAPAPSLACGVGNNEEPVAAVRGANGSRDMPSHSASYPLAARSPSTRSSPRLRRRARSPRGRSGVEARERFGRTRTRAPSASPARSPRLSPRPRCLGRGRPRPRSSRDVRSGRRTPLSQRAAVGQFGRLHSSGGQWPHRSQHVSTRLRRSPGRRSGPAARLAPKLQPNESAAPSH